MDFEMDCEITVRDIFQCGRFDDPIGRLANAGSWSGLLSNEFSEVYRCMSWSVLSRLQNEYLDSKVGREDLFEQSEYIEERILKATTNKEIYDSMIEIQIIVKKLNLNEFPHISYQNTNDIN